MLACGVALAYEVTLVCERKVTFARGVALANRR